MKIKRVDDRFIVDIRKKQFKIYWSKNLEFGENLIKRFFERVTEKDLDHLCKYVEIINKYGDDLKSMTNEEFREFLTSCEIIRRILTIQFIVRFCTVDSDRFKNFVEACRARTYEFEVKKFKGMFKHRFDNLETPTQIKAEECSCFEDWVVIRGLVARQLVSEFTERCHLFLREDAEKALDLKDKPVQETRIRENSFVAQLFLDVPARPNLDVACVKTPFVERIYNGIRTIFKNRNKYNKKSASSEEASEYTNMRNKLTELHAKLAEIYIRHSVIEPRQDMCNWSNEYRRQVVLDFFMDWDTNMPDDIAFLKEQQRLREQSDREKQEAIDKSDIEYTGKTQAQWKEEQKDLEMEIKDESGNVVHTEKIQ